MRLLSVIGKSFQEQLRYLWILVLTVTMAPFFVGVYYLIAEATQPRYDLLILNHDRGNGDPSAYINHGDFLVDLARHAQADSLDRPFAVATVPDRETAETRLKNKLADALVVLPGNFSQALQALSTAETSNLQIEFVGDLSDVNYMITAVWAGEMLGQYISGASGRSNPFFISETSLGISGQIDDFDLYTPGLLILALIMLMFSASIAIVTEVEQKTIIRLKLSRLRTVEFLTGISVIQVLVGLISILLTLLVATRLGFEYAGSLGLLILLAILTSISMIAFSLIIAAATKTANEVLIVGNFPLLLFMFFTGAAFPIHGQELFTVAGYPFTLQGLMSPTHAVNALKKVLIFNLGIGDIIPEIVSILLLTMIYFGVGVLAFQRRHMRMV